MKYVFFIVMMLMSAGLGIYGGYQTGYTDGSAHITTGQCVNSAVDSVRNGIRELVK